MFLIQKGLMERPSEIHSAEKSRGTPHRPTIQEEVVDAIGYLFLEHMPILLMVATITFPLILGVGGILTAGSELWVFPAIALISVLSIIGIVGAMARQIMLETCRGVDDPPPIPELGRLAPAAVRFMTDGVAVLGLCLLPGLAAVQLGQHWIISALLLALGGLLAPMCLALRQTRNDWRGLSPHLFVPAIRCVGTPYLKLVVFSALVFSPAVAAAFLTVGSDLYLRLSFIGPLAIAPLFLVSRLMGRTILLDRRRLGHLIADQTGQLDREVSRLAPEAIETYEPRRISSGKHRQNPTPRRRRHRLRNSARQAAIGRHPEMHTAPEEVRQGIRERVSKAVAHSEQQDPTAARMRAEAEVLQKAQIREQKAEARRVEAQCRAEALRDKAFGTDTHPDSLPDLSNIPGARILQGDERRMAGAAALRP